MLKKMINLRKFIDIGANLTDPMYQGIYHESQKHQPDLDKVLKRSWENNLSKIIITAGSVNESRKALEIARTDGLFIDNFLNNQVFNFKENFSELFIK